MSVIWKLRGRWLRKAFEWEGDVTTISGACLRLADRGCVVSSRLIFHHPNLLLCAFHELLLASFILVNIWIRTSGLSSRDLICCLVGRPEFSRQVITANSRRERTNPNVFPIQRNAADVVVR